MQCLRAPKNWKGIIFIFLTIVVLFSIALVKFDDFTGLKPFYQKFQRRRLFAKVEEENLKRLKVMEEMCVKLSQREAFKIPEKKINVNKSCSSYKCPMLVQDKYKFMMCVHAKCGSSSLKSFALRTFNHKDFNRSDVSLHISSEILPRVTLGYYNSTVQSKYFSFVFVRHPFVRILSSYNDKFGSCKDNKSANYNALYCRHIPKMRKLIGAEPAESNAFSFEQFLQFLAKSPPRQYDSHWKIYMNRCNPCIQHFDFIGKVETFDEDFSYIKHKIGIEDFQLRHVNRKDSDSLIEEYYSGVNKSLVRKLAEIYENDLLVFNYDYKVFYDFAKEE